MSGVRGPIDAVARYVRRAAAAAANDDAPAGEGAAAGRTSAPPADGAATSRVWRWFRYSPLLAQLVVTRRCNLACGYCSEFDRTSPLVPAEVLRERVDHLARLGTVAIDFTGGEPLLHPQLGELVAHARNRRFVSVRLNSNGYLMTERRIEELNAAGLDEAQVSVDGVKANETTVKALEPLRPKLELLARLARFDIVLSGVVGSGATVAEVEEVIRFARDHGFRPRILLVHHDDGQLALRPADLAMYRGLQRKVGFHLSDMGDYREKLIAHGRAPFRCRAGSRYLYIDELGIVRWCSQTREIFGKPLADYGPHDLRRQYHTPKRCNTGCTLGCARTCSLFDEWLPQDGPPAGSRHHEPPPASSAQDDPQHAAGG
ncbi:MAG: radical SAM protein [Deltaproteobacteria bacterium]|nr:radical SAM protein [Deltaproteobacteria bacterium]